MYIKNNFKIIKEPNVETYSFYSKSPLVSHQPKHCWFVRSLECHSFSRGLRKRNNKKLEAKNHDWSKLKYLILEQEDFFKILSNTIPIFWKTIKIVYTNNIKLKVNFYVPFLTQKYTSNTTLCMRKMQNCLSLTILNYHSISFITEFHFYLVEVKKLIYP